MNRLITARISNLPYRRIPFGWLTASFRLARTSAPWRIGNPRYSRLEIRATEPNGWSIAMVQGFKARNVIWEILSPFRNEQA